MMHRTKRDGDLFKDFWNGIGGKLEKDESPEECVIREVLEESGLTIRNPKLKGIATFPNNHDTGETWYVFIYTTNDFKGKLIENDEGKLEWVPIKDIPSLNIQNADRHFLQWLNKDKIFSAKFYYIHNTLKDFNVVFY